MSLFRQQVLDAQNNRLQGHVILLPRLPHTLLCVALAIWLAAVLTLLLQAQYSRKETALGWLEPAAGIVGVYAHSEGKLAQLLVAEGDQIVAGQPLAVINGDRILADGQHLETLLLEQYAVQQSALQRQLVRAGTLSQIRHTELAERLHSAEQELLWMGERNQTLDQRQALLQRRNQRHQSLVSRGHVTAVELEALQEQELQIQSDRQTMSIEQLRQQALVQALRSELDRLQDETANTEDQIRLQLSDLAQQMAQLRGNRAYVLKASVAGTVSNIQLHEGQRARRNVALLQLVPAHSKLLAQLLVPVRAGGFLHSGQVLLIRYDAFPYQKFGSYYGVIESVASTAAMPGDSSDLPFNLSEPVYRVTASLKRHTVRAYGEDFALKSGMTLSADIKLEQRSLLQWLLEPLFSLSGRLV